MTGSDLKKALRSGQRAYGTLITSPSPYWVVPVQRLGLDFVFIDTEHVAIDREKLSWMCHAYRAAGLAPLVRIPSPDPYAASMAIDGGAVGIVAPYIETAEEVRRLVGAAKYRPIKGARLQALLSEMEPVEQSLREYMDRGNSEHLLIANIESRPALRALDDILAVDELDAVLVGPHDLSCSLGLPERYEAPSFVEAVEEIIGKARARGKGAGIHMFDPTRIEQEIRFLHHGANLVIHSADLLSFAAAMRADVARLREAMGETVAKGADAPTNI